MRHKKIKGCMAFILCALISMTGCGAMNKQTKETSFYKLTIDGDMVYYPENVENVQNLIGVTNEFINVFADTDYTKPEQLEKELDYYTEAKRTELNEQKYVDRVVEQLNTYKTKQEVVEIGNYGVQFYSFEGKKRAKVTCDYISVMNNATENYLQISGLKLNTNYKRTFTIDFELENGEWKIENQKASAREEV